MIIGTAEHTSEAIIPYGPHEAQTVQLRSPARGVSERRGVVVLIHGGYWRARYDASLMDALASDLAERGWATANVEYRRSGNGGGWPETPDDIQAALRMLADHEWRRRFGGPLIGIGHSVGGQLALLAARQLDAVVALAPVTDASRTYSEGLGEHAAAEFFGASPDQRPQAYAEASPVEQTPLGIPVLIVHGAGDDRVPLEHSLDYAFRAHRSGDPVDLLVLHELSHIDAIDPARPHWGAVLERLSAIVGDHDAAQAP